MSNFPFELLEHIFSYLQDDQLCECIKVRKLWYSMASRKIYEELNLFNYTNRNFVRNLQSMRIDGSMAGDMVKSCSLQFCYFTVHGFQELIYCLANLRVIKDIQPEHLRNLDNRNILDRLTCLEELSMDDFYDWDDEFVDLFLPVNVQLKDQITSLTLWPLSMFVRISEYKNLPTILSGFSTLEKLCIHIDDDMDIEAINLISILNSCSRLTSLDFENKSDWKIDTSRYSVIHTSLKSLKLNVSNLSDIHLEYMIQHLPNLKDLNLWVDSGFGRILATTNPSVISKYAMYLKRMEHVKIQASWSPLQRRVDDVEIPISESILRKFLQDLRDEGCYCDLEAYVLSPTELSSDIYLRKQNRYVYWHCNISLDPSNFINWIVQQLNFVLFRSIKIHETQENRTLQSSNDGLCNWIQPLMELLKQQQHKQVCSIDIRDSIYRVEFGSNRAHIRRQPLVKYGHLSMVTLKSEMLKDFGQLYSNVEALELGQCTIEKDDNKVRTFQIDLSWFGKLKRLEFDLDRIFPHHEKIVLPLYIDFINVTMQDYSRLYCYREKSDTLYGFENHYALMTTGPYYLVKIYHTGISSFAFKRFHRKIQVCPYLHFTH